jgi:adenine-specific DNA-methyltransferase
MSQKYAKLKTLLKELFQLDQPDLDFGFYRVMHARAAEVTQFLDKDLLPQVKAAFAQYQPADKAVIEKELAKAIEQAQALGADPETLPKVKELRARLAEDAVDLNALEAEVYDHLFSFFRRYYSEGDFLSKRVYKPGVYAIPYEGEEVKLHWANADQYYIKTSEYLRDYAFRLRPDDDKHPMRVHLRLVDAAEGEHGNVKEQAGKERRFKLAAENFAAVEDGELVIRFTYEPDPAKQKELNAAAETAILGLRDASLADWVKALGVKHVRADGTAAEATRLRVHLDRYTARNTFDYFIHKDLGGFLRRELDFYIKNEVMHLDDVENESVPRVEQYLSKIKVIRRIAGKIIAFLAQLEDFQKKLWLKKKFVVETSWCIRLGVIPEAFYPEIAANDAQREEWVRLCAIDEIKPSGGNLLEAGTPGYSKPLTPVFLKAQPTLMVDTRHFDAAFVARLLDMLGDVDGTTDGVLFYGDNCQALSVMRTRTEKRIGALFADPPYNTGADEFAYRDNYRHSSWLTMMESVLGATWNIMSPLGTLWVTLDDNEAERLWLAAGEWLGFDSGFPRIAWQHSIQGKGYDGSVSVHHNSLLCFARSRDARIGLLEREERHNRAYGNPDSDPKGEWRTGDVRNSLYRPNLRYRIPTPSGGFLDPPDNGWRWSWDTMQAKIASGEVFFSEDDSRIIRKIYLADQEGRVPESIWFGEEVGTTRSANAELKDLFGSVPFGTPKPTGLVDRICTLSAADLILDCFAGSGTTGHAVINLNREDGAERKFILVEQGDYFDTVLLPRLKKVTFTPEWKDGKPKRLATPEEAERSPRIMKVVRLESYEDALNNLELRRTDTQAQLLLAPEAQGADKLKEQYILRYLLDVETRGSQSLLNVAAFTDPTAYTLKVKRPGSDESREVNVDLLETFNWLIGLTVQHLAAPQTFSAETERDGEGRLRLKGRLRRVQSSVATVQETKAAAPSLKTEPLKTENDYWFRTVTGTTPDGRKTLVIWRKRPGGESAEGIERDNLVLDEWFTKQGYSSKDSEFDLIYVNGDNNLENLKAPDDTWKVRLIEEDFFRLMFETEGV